MNRRITLFFSSSFRSVSLFDCDTSIFVRTVRRSHSTEHTIFQLIRKTLIAFKLAANKVSVHRSNGNNETEGKKNNKQRREENGKTNMKRKSYWIRDPVQNRKYTYIFSLSAFNQRTPILLLRIGNGMECNGNVDGGKCAPRSMYGLLLCLILCAVRVTKSTVWACCVEPLSPLSWNLSVSRAVFEQKLLFDSVLFFPVSFRIYAVIGMSIISVGFSSRRLRQAFDAIMCVWVKAMAIFLYERRLFTST